MTPYDLGWAGWFDEEGVHRQALLPPSGHLAAGPPPARRFAAALIEATACPGRRSADAGAP